MAEILSDEQVKASWAGTICPCCGEAKRERTAFAPSCFSALTIWARRPLFTGPDSPHYLEAFQSALRHLQLNPVRRKRFAVLRGGWSYRTADELRAAGYRYCDFAHCKVPGCSKKIYWYRGPDTRQVAVDLGSYQPHRTTCADPEYFARQRQLDQEAKAAKRAARRGGRSCR